MVRGRKEQLSNVGGTPGDVIVVSGTSYDFASNDQALDEVLAVGNETDGYNIEISDGDDIRAPDGYLDLNILTTGLNPNGSIRLQEDGTTFLEFDPSSSVSLRFASDAGTITFQQEDETTANTSSGDWTIQAQGVNSTQTGPGTTGGQLSLLGGDSTKNNLGSVIGGSVLVQGGLGDGTSSATGSITGGAVTISGGTTAGSGGITQTGGAININGGNVGGPDNGSGGNVNITGGSSIGLSGGNIVLTPGSGTSDGNITLDFATWPTTDGNNGEVLVTDGAGNLSFAATSITAIDGYSDSFLDGHTSTDDTPTLVGNGFDITTDNDVVKITAHILGRDQTNGDSAGYELTGIFERTSGTVSQVGNTISRINEEEDITWDVDFGISGTSVLIQITGDAANNVDWAVIGEVRKLLSS